MHVGQTIGDYLLQHELGSGGMGAVYEGRHRATGRRVAIKVLHAHLATNEHLAFRFVNEGRAASIIDHPGVVRVYESGRTRGGEVYLVMEFLEGEPLGRLLRREPRLAPSRALAIAHEVARTLAVVHTRGVVHRDLKPDNIMLVPDPARPGEERVKLLDFGVAKIVQEHIETLPRDLITATGDILGTPLYMAPEQCRGARRTDGKADVYALGVLLYRMLAGDTPFRGTTLAELMTQHIGASPPPLGAKVPEAPAALTELVQRMLVKYPLHRPTAHDVANTLAGLLGRAGAADAAPALAPTEVVHAPEAVTTVRFATPVTPPPPTLDAFTSLSCATAAFMREHPVTARAAAVVAGLFVVQFVLMVSMVLARLSGRA